MEGVLKHGPLNLCNTSEYRYIESDDLRTKSGGCKSDGVRRFCFRHEALRARSWFYSLLDERDTAQIRASMRGSQVL